jgi:hypothetical protein
LKFITKATRERNLGVLGAYDNTGELLCIAPTIQEVLDLLRGLNYDQITGRNLAHRLVEIHAVISADSSRSKVANYVFDAGNGGLTKAAQPCGVC